MLVAPPPILSLFRTLQAHVHAVLAALFPQIGTVSTILAFVPRVIVPVIPVIDPSFDDDPLGLQAGNGRNHDRSGKSPCQSQGMEKGTFALRHRCTSQSR